MTLFALIGIALIVISLRLPHGPIQMGPTWMIIAGALISAFGWVYPHFLQASSFWPYLVASPVGLVPCATLSITIGLAIMLMGLTSRAWSLVLSIAGVFWLGVQIEWILFIGAAILVLAVLLTRREMAVSAART